MHALAGSRGDGCGGRYEARVLVPSPPAVNEPPWFADDPSPSEGEGADRPVVSPVPNGDTTWDALALEEPGLREWCRDPLARRVGAASRSRRGRGAVTPGTAHVGRVGHQPGPRRRQRQDRVALHLRRRRDALLRHPAGAASCGSTAWSS